MGREGETPPKFFLIGIKKKWHKLSKLGGGGWGRGNLDKIQKNSYFFSGNLALGDLRQLLGILI